MLLRDLPQKDMAFLLNQMGRSHMCKERHVEKTKEECIRDIHAHLCAGDSELSLRDVGWDVIRAMAINHGCDIAKTRRESAQKKPTCWFQIYVAEY